MMPSLQVILPHSENGSHSDIVGHLTPIGERYLDDDDCPLMLLANRPSNVTGNNRFPLNCLRCPSSRRRKFLRSLSGRRPRDTIIDRVLTCPTNVWGGKIGSTSRIFLLVSDSFIHYGRGLLLSSLYPCLSMYSRIFAYLFNGIEGCKYTYWNAFYSYQ